MRFYLCQKYYPCEEKINPYHHFLYEHFSKVISENFREKIAIFEIDNFKEKNYHNQDEKCFLFFYIVLKRIGEEYLFENLDVFLEIWILKKVFKDYSKKVI